MSKPEFWWCIKAENKLQAFTASLNKFVPVSIWLKYLNREKLRVDESVVRICVKEAHKGGRR